MKELLCLSLLLCSSSAFADDAVEALAKIPRSLKKEPAYQGSPGYLFLVFGDDLSQLRWLVVDGKTAYFDRNGNGDLTDPEDRLQADAELSDETEQHFKLGEITIGGLKHHRLAFSVTTPDQLTHHDDAPPLTGLPAQAKVISLWGEFEIPGFTGRCAYGRVPRCAGPYDKDGYLLLAKDLATARIIHFGRRWSVQLDGEQKLFQGTEKEIVLNVGSRGLGAGTFNRVGYEKVIPDNLQPRVTIAFPKMNGSGLQEHQVTLKQRCCTYRLYGPVRVPGHVPSGKVQVALDFSDWATLTHPKSTGELSIRRLPVVPVQEPVSPQLFKTLQHPDRDSNFASLKFSKDGKRLWAAGNFEGTLVLYDVASGSRLTQIDIGKANRAWPYFAHVSPDERTVIAVRERHGQHEYYEKDNQPMARFHGSQGIRRWDFETGELLWTDNRPVQGAMLEVKLSPSGKVFIAEEIMAQERRRQTTPQRQALFGDAVTGKLTPLPAGLSAHGFFSPDGKVFATFQRIVGGQHEYIQAMKLLDGDRFQELGSWPVKEPFSHCYLYHFTAKRQLIFHQTVYARELDRKRYTTRLLLLDMSKADSQPQVLLADIKELSNFVLNRDESKLLFIAKDGHQYSLKQLDIVNGKEALATPLPSGAQRFYGSRHALSHNGKYLALPLWSEIPKELFAEEELKPEQLGQPRIILVEVATGKVVETFISPPAFLGGFAFSPDDKTLASSGQGCIHLWDISHLK